jgi:hypothetical protein
MSKKNTVQKFAFAALAGLGLAATGCGSAANPTIPAPLGGTGQASTTTPTYTGPGSVQCPAGQSILPTGACALTSDWVNQCQYYGGTIATGNLCKMTLHYLWSGYYFTPTMTPAVTQFTFSSFGSFPTLGPDQPAGPYAFNTGIYLKQNDKLSLSASGGYSLKSYVMFNFSFGSTNYSSCNDISVAGMNGSSAVTNPNNGQPAELYGSDGTTAFAIGASVNQTISTNGVLRIGFNAPASVNGCFSAQLTNVTVTRCMDSSGNSPACP